MSEQGIKEIVLIVKDEESIYVPYDQEIEFNPKVKAYIISKIRDEDVEKDFRLKVISSTELDEERFKVAVLNWISDDKGKYQDKLKQNNHVQKVLIIVGFVFIGLSMLWERMIGINEFIYRISRSVFANAKTDLAIFYLIIKSIFYQFL